MSFLKFGHGFLQRSDFFEEGGVKPLYFGRISVGQEGEEVDVEIAGWIKQNEKTNKKYISLALSVKEEVAVEATEATEVPETEEETDVPF